MDGKPRTREIDNEARGLPAARGDDGARQRRPAARARVTIDHALETHEKIKTRNLARGLARETHAHVMAGLQQFRAQGVMPSPRGPARKPKLDQHPRVSGVAKINARQMARAPASNQRYAN